MILAWSADGVRAAEAPLLAAEVPLMAHAAFALHVAVLDEVRSLRGTAHGGRVAVLVGPGNNGGDALHAAALLARRGLRVEVLLAATRVHAEGLRAARRAGVAIGASDEPVEAAAERAAAADVVVDGLLGIGSDGSGLRGRAAELVAALKPRLDPSRPEVFRPGPPRPSASQAESLPQSADDAVLLGPAREPSRRLVGSARLRVVAVDVPSGIGVDDGRLSGAVLPADLTVTFGAVKPGLLLPPSSLVGGRLRLVDLALRLPGGPAVRRLDRDDVAALWPVPGASAHKYVRGVLGVVAGTPRYPGAAVLAAGGAIGAGVGMVRFLDEAEPDDEPGPGEAFGPLAAAVLAAHPEVVVGPGRVQAWLLGSGVDPDDEARAAQVEAALAEVAKGTPAVLDAGALVLVGRRRPTLGPHAVLTPHAGELAQLLTALGEPTDRSQVEAEPSRAARLAQQLTGATVLLKGSTTIVVGPDETYAQADAPPWLATAGAGDVLAGVLGALLAGRADDVRAEPALAARLAAAAALVHGLAATRANPGGPVAAGAVARAVPATVSRLLTVPTGGRVPRSRR